MLSKAEKAVLLYSQIQLNDETSTQRPLALRVCTASSDTSSIYARPPHRRIVLMHR